MIVVDSSGWIEYFSRSSTGLKYSSYIEKINQLIVPSLVVYEVYKWIKRHHDEEEALKYIAQMHEAQFASLDDSLALHAADISLEHKLAMADAIVYATALSYNAKLVTSDNDFQNLPHIIYLAKEKE